MVDLEELAGRTESITQCEGEDFDYVSLLGKIKENDPGRIHKIGSAVSRYEEKLSEIGGMLETGSVSGEIVGKQYHVDMEFVNEEPPRGIPAEYFGVAFAAIPMGLSSISRKLAEKYDRPFFYACENAFSPISSALASVGLVVGGVVELGTSLVAGLFRNLRKPKEQRLYEKLDCLRYDVDRLLGPEILDDNLRRYNDEFAGYAERKDKIE